MTGWLALLVLAGWMTYAWRGGTLLVREVRRALELAAPVMALSIVAGVGANALNLGYELGARLWGWSRVGLGVPLGLRVAGLVLALLGFGVVARARYALGSGWSPLLERTGAVVVTSGPYRIVRHPIYAGAIYLYAGLLLAQADLTGALVFGAHIVAFAVKAAVEDRALARGDEAYRRYTTATPWKLVPFLY